jgi:hypothetical protein
MSRRLLDPPRSTSESALHRSMLTQVTLQGVIGVLVFSPLVLDAFDDRFDVVRLVMLVVWLTAVVLFVAQFRALSSWRSLPVAAGEQMAWGTTATLIRPGGGLGYGGQFSLSTHRLRFVPGPVSHLRGATAEEWPVERLTAVRVTPGTGRALASGRWVVIDVEGADPVTLLSPEPRNVADDIDQVLAERLRR